MLKFYYSTAPNPLMVALYLEETSIPYEPMPIDTRRGSNTRLTSHDQSECQIAGHH